MIVFRQWPKGNLYVDQYPSDDNPVAAWVDSAGGIIITSPDAETAALIRCWMNAAHGNLEIAKLCRDIRPDMLTGPHHAAKRAEIVSRLTGEKTPKSKAGITRLMSLLYARFTVRNGSLNAMENELRVAIVVTLTVGGAL